MPPPGVIQELVLHDGTRAYGRIERVDADRVTFRTTAGATIEVDVAQVDVVRVAAGRMVRGAFWPADPNPTRLFFAPTGRSIPRGSGYFGVYEILLPFVQVGVTERFSMGAGTPLVFGLGGDHPFWITPKVQLFDVASTQAAAGVLHFMNVGDGQLGIGYGVVTHGSADSAITAGVGYGYERSYGDNDGSVLGLVGGEHRVTRRVKLITENYVWRRGGLASAGVRFLGDRLTADIGLVVPLGTDSLIAIPIINFVWQFSFP